MLNVALNEGIKRRGLSGSAVACDAIRSALTDMARVEFQPLARGGQPRDLRAANALSDAIWDFYAAPRMARDGIIIHPANVGGRRRGVCSCLVLHDTMVLDHPERFDPGFVAYARCLFPVAVRLAGLVLTPSEVTASRIRTRWPRARIEVVPWPVRVARSKSFRTQSRSHQVLVLAATDPHKRHQLAIETVRLLRLLSGIPYTLVFVGAQGRAERRVRTLAGIADPTNQWIFRRPMLSDAQLVAEIDDSWALLATSEDEGFCLPLIEAAARAVPVVHTGAGAMAEVMPAGAVSSSAFDLAAALAALIDDSRYREASSTAWERSKLFDPADFARRLGGALALVS